MVAAKNFSKCSRRRSSLCLNRRHPMPQQEPKVGEQLIINGQAIGTVLDDGKPNPDRIFPKLEILAPDGTTFHAHLPMDTGLIFGIPMVKMPYRGNLVGNKRIRYRTDDFARIYVRDP